MVMGKFWQLCMDMPKILVVVTFWWGIDFLLLDIDFFRCMGIFGHVGLGYGN